MDHQDIIVAPATPPGEGGVAIVRLSGPGCLVLALPYFHSSLSIFTPETHHLYHGFLRDLDGQTIDEIMFVYMASPRSFTAEDVVEIHCHAGHQTLKRVLNLFINAGARLAKPGEFSYRAFQNGRIDLSQAEAIAELIHARSEKAQTLALAQMDGQLSQTLHKYTAEIIESLALIEAWIDFPEEELPDEDMEIILKRVYLSIERLQGLIDSYNTGRYYSEGVALLLLGKPNVGKSSLMNALLGEERAIVTEIEGTTRDLLEEGLVVHGLPVRLVDSAGLRTSNDPIERVGVERATNRIKSADLILFLVDGSRGFDVDDQAAFMACSGKKTLLLQTKSDLPMCVEFPPEFSAQAIKVSAKTGKGLDLLRDSIYAELVTTDARSDNSVILTTQRHQVSALNACVSLQRFITAQQQGMSLEFLAVDLREALSALGEITGETTTDDILDAVFSRFCIGK